MRIRTIKGKMIFVVTLVTTLALLASGVVAALIAKGKVMDSFEQQMTSTAEKSAQNVNAWIEKEIANVESAAKDIGILNIKDKSQVMSVLSTRVLGITDIVMDYMLDLKIKMYSLHLEQNHQKDLIVHKEIGINKPKKKKQQ